MNVQTLINGERTVEGVLKNVLAGYQHLTQSTAAADVISKFPSLGHLISEIAAFIPGIQQGMAVADILLDYGPMLYTVGRMINLAPMEAGKSVHDNDLSREMGG
jgi:hypothetical protein